MKDSDAPIIGIERHRLMTDGKGITTLVAFHGCPLRCAYCINPQCFNTRPTSIITVKRLIDILKRDNLYFLATGGGVTFGGGEPLLWSNFLYEYITSAPKEWNITIETSLNIPLDNLKQVSVCTPDFIIDIKDLNNDTYRRYTGKDNEQVKTNLIWLAENGYADNAIIRLPLIPQYNSTEEIDKSKRLLIEMGFSYFDEFKYRI